MNDVTTKQKILIVDDEPTNIDLLRSILSDYEIMATCDGNEALKACSKNPPDLILLDIIMPGMDGYEVCKRLKNNQTTNDIPIIFITAKTSAQDEAKGIELGGIDYIRKPFAYSVVTARIKNHLSLKWYRDELQSANNLLNINVKSLQKADAENKRLQEEQQKQQAQSVHANRLATLGEMATGIAHEINQPLAGISLTAGFLKKAFEMKS